MIRYKKVLAVILSAAMVMSSFGTAFAAETAETEDAQVESAQAEGSQAEDAAEEEAEIEEASEEDEATEEVLGVELDSAAAEETLAEETLSEDEIEVSENEVNASLAISDAGGYFESAFVELTGVEASAVTAVSWEGTASGSLSTTDISYLAREEGSGVRIDIPGLKAGSYKVTVKAGGSSVTTDSLTVNEYDRSGFAHFNYTSGVGAYKDDGTLKDNAIVLYVTDDNKNDVELTYDGTTVKGIGNILNTVGKDSGTGYNSNGGTANTNADILKKLGQDNIPLVVRFIGCVSDSGLYKRGTFSAASTCLINGLTEYDSVNYGGTEGDNGHMARMRSGKNITLEGIGTDATIDGWGFHFICESSAPDLGKSFELRNLTFINTPEDAVGMEGVQASKNASSEISASVERCWIHNNEFYGPSISNPAESDKGEGDGSCDFKRGQYLTVDYNYFESCHKTCLVGSADYSLQFNLTYHHNYWYLCKARGPLTRRANVHMYNNFIFGQTDYAMNTRADAYIFSEGNMFYMCKSPQAVEAGAIKSYMDSFSSYIQNKGSLGTVVDDKTDLVDNACKYSYGNVDYSKFDTTSSQSYIPGGNYSVNYDMTEAKKEITAYVGVQKDKFIEVDDVKEADYSILEVMGLSSSDTVTSDTTLYMNGGKKTKVPKVFKVEMTSDITVTVDSASSESAVLVSAAGECLLSVAPGSSGTAHGVPAGTYAVQPNGLQPSKDQVAVPTFKEVTVSSIEVASAGAYDKYTLTGIEMNQSSASMMSGATLTLSAKKVPSTGKSTGTMEWTSSDTSVATVSSKGLVTAVGNGTATITASLDGFTTSCSIKVTDPVYLDGISLGSTYLNVAKGSTVALDASVYPADTTDNYEITYSVADSSIASVDSNGTVKGLAVGETTITAKATVVEDEGDDAEEGASYEASCTVNVYNNPVASIDGAINYNVTEKLVAGDTYFKFSNANTKAVTGSYESANFGSLSFTKAMKVESKTSVIFIAPADGDLIIVADAASKGIKINGTAQKTGSDGVLTVSVSSGTDYEITKSDSCNVFYFEFVPSAGTPSTEIKDVTSVTLDKSSLTIAKAGDTATLTATVSPSDASVNLVNFQSSDPLVASVDSSTGVVTGVGKGTATITAYSVYDSTKSASCSVEVLADADVVAVTGVTLSKTSVEIEKPGMTETITATVAPSNATKTGVRWTSSDAEVAKVSNGVITAVGKGSATITAIAVGDSTKTATCTVKVLKNADVEVSYSFSAANFLTSINAFTDSNTYGVLDEGGTGLKTAYEAKGSENAKSYGEIFSFENWKIPSKKTNYIGLIAGESGTFTIAAPGAGTIVLKGCSSGSDKSADIVLKNSAGTVLYSQTVKGSSDTTLTWPATEAGDYTVTYADGFDTTKGELRINTVDVKCNLESVDITGIALDQTSVTLKDPGDTVTLKPIYTPSNTSDLKVSWSSSDTSVAKVSDGLVTAINKGTAVITVTSKADETIKATCTVTVTNSVAVTVTKVTLNKSSLSLKAGDSQTLTATVEPSNATIQTVSWSSSDTSVATVDENGKVTAVAKGSAVITAVSDQNKDAKASCAVTVTDNGSSGGGDGKDDDQGSGDGYTQPVSINSTTDISGNKVENGVQLDVRVSEENVYTSKAVKPSIILSINGIVLTQNVDYKLSYKNNKLPSVNAAGESTITLEKKKPMITIKMMGQYKKVKFAKNANVVNFDIQPMDLSAMTVDVTLANNIKTVKTVSTNKAVKKVIVKSVVMDPAKGAKGIKDLKLNAKKDIESIKYIKATLDSEGTPVSYSGELLDCTQLTPGETYGIVITGKDKFYGSTSQTAPVKTITVPTALK